MCVCDIFFISSLVDGPLGWVHILVIMNSVAIYIRVQILQHTDFLSFGYILSSGVTGGYGSSDFSFLNNSHPAFHNG